MTSIDSADEAGGEAIYSSDGLPSLAAPRAPKLASNVSTSGNDVLDSNDLVDPAAAMSIFSPTSKESAHAKLARLQREAAELEKELQGEDVSKLVLALASQIGNRLNEQDNLTKLLDDYKKKEKTEGKKEETDGLVYELYGGTAASLSATDERIIRLEHILGSSGTNEPCIMTRLQDLEIKMQRVDAKSLDDAATRAKVIRSDLEAASKARSKLTSSSSSADNKTISELHAQLIQLEGLSEHLPSLTHRLQQLAHLHVSAANFSSRLTQSEESLANIQGTLANLELSLAKIEQSMVENVQTMDSNLKKLEERLG